MTRFTSGLCLLALTACAGHRESPVGFTRVPEAPVAEDGAPRPKPHAPPPPEDIVERSALPLRGVRLADNTALDERRLFDELSRYDAVCVGEQHDDPHHHFAELRTLEELGRRARHGGEALGVGLEMFQAPSQGYLDAFSRGRLDEASLLAKTEYEERWGFPFAFYRPLLETARASGLPLLALNARRELTREVAKHGLALPPELERELPALELYDPNHRALFDELMTGHPKGHGSPDNLYAAQVVWDETMAARASDFLLGFRPVRKLVVIAGLAHCADPSVPARIERRTGLKVASVRVSVGAPEDTRFYDYAIVLDRQ